MSAEKPSQKGKTLLKGHVLMYEGKALSATWEAKEGIGGCWCGARSKSLPSNAARQLWYRQHKEELRMR